MTLMVGEGDGSKGDEQHAPPTVDGTSPRLLLTLPGADASRELSTSRMTVSAGVPPASGAPGCDKQLRIRPRVALTPICDGDCSRSYPSIACGKHPRPQDAISPPPATNPPVPCASR